MPAIDLSRLEREVEQLQRLLGSPGELSRSVLEILDFYSERARRPSDALAGEKPGRSLNVPAPVVRAIGMGLMKRASENPEGLWAAADALWDTGWREPRVLAAWLLSSLGDERVADWIEGRAAALGDPAVIAALVDRALPNWRRLGGVTYVDRVGRWLASSRSGLQALGLRALEAALDMPELEDMHRAFEALAGLRRPVRGEAREAFTDLLATLARRSPAETARYMLEAIDAGQPGIERFARSLLPEFPPAQRERLTAALASRSSGKPTA